MLFQDGQKFILDEEDLNQLRQAFPDYMNKNKILRITYNEGVVQKIETNNPASPFVFSKPTHNILLVNKWVDNETGEQREIRFSNQPARYRGDGSSYFAEKNIVIDTSFIFKPSEDIELLWFCYNFSKLFANGIKGNDISPFRFLVQHADATTKANDVLAEANAKVALSNLSMDKLISFAKNYVALEEDDSKEIILAKLFSTMDGSKNFKNTVIKQFTQHEVESDAEGLVNKAIAAGVLKSNEDGDQVVMVLNGKETIVADIPFDEKGLLITYVSKEKKLYNQLKKALS
jgi:hypothetical protein